MAQVSSTGSVVMRFHKIINSRPNVNHCCRHAKSIVCLYAFVWTTTEHAGGSGVQLSVGVEMEAHGDQAAAASHQLLKI